MLAQQAPGVGGGAGGLSLLSPWPIYSLSPYTCSGSPGQKAWSLAPGGCSCRVGSGLDEGGERPIACQPLTAVFCPQAQVRLKGAGLGAKGSAYGLSGADSYKDAVRKAMFARFTEME